LTCFSLTDTFLCCFYSAFWAHSLNGQFLILYLSV
jgi:hypothetical protein